MMYRLVVALLVLVLGGCGEGSPVEQTVSATSSPGPDKTVVAEEWSALAGFPNPPGINWLANESDAAITGRVQSIGERQALTQSHVHTSYYREVVVVVERVLWDSERMEVSPDQELRVVTYGDGTETGGTVSGYPVGRVHVNELSGPLRVGSDVLFVLGLRDAPAAGDESRPWLFGNYLGNWLLEDDGTARSLDPKRNVPADRLIRELREERERGRAPGETRGQRNPFQESEEAGPPTQTAESE